MSSKTSARPQVNFRIDPKTQRQLAEIVGYLQAGVSVEDRFCTVHPPDGQSLTTLVKSIVTQVADYLLPLAKNEYQLAQLFEMAMKARLSDEPEESFDLEEYARTELGIATDLIQPMLKIVSVWVENSVEARCPDHAERFTARQQELHLLQKYGPILESVWQEETAELLADTTDRLKQYQAATTSRIQAQQPAGQAPAVASDP